MVLPLMLIAAGMNAVGGIAQGITGLSAARARASALRAAADQKLAEGGVAAQVGYGQDERGIAHAFTQAAAGGGGFGGSAVNVLNDLAGQQALRVRNTIYGAQTEARGLQGEANTAVSDAKRALMGSVFGAAGSMLGAAGAAHDAKIANLGRQPQAVSKLASGPY